MVRQNVNQTNLIQVGLTLADAEGRTPWPCCSWQFHLAFDLASERGARESIELLQKAGIPFDQLPLRGI